jgi:NADH:ubiquinone oxidoreductase subunit 5 (subunit L)/multisubunit Na+/H+ antiporter MnhA subunit
VVPILASVVFVLGALAAFGIYRNRASDPIVIPLLANKFYIDELYSGLIRWTQDLLARLCAWFDRWILDGALIRLLFSGGTYGAGFALRLLQLGNLQAYGFLFGLGVIALLYFVLLK